MSKVRWDGEKERRLEEMFLEGRAIRGVYMEGGIDQVEYVERLKKLTKKYSDLGLRVKEIFYSL